jgi:hypothetical protein
MTSVVIGTGKGPYASVSFYIKLDTNLLTCFVAESFLYKIKTTVPECREHVAEHEQLEDVLREEDVHRWRAEVLAWEADHSKTNPYAVRVKSESNC